MMMSQATNPSPFSVLHPHPSTATSFGCGTSILPSPSNPSVKVSSSVGRSTARKPAAASEALKQLGTKSSVARTPLSPLASSSRPLQPVDVNLSKAAREQACRSRSSSSSSSYNVSASHTAYKKVRSPSSKEMATSSRSAVKATRLGSILGHSASVTLKGERISVKVPQKLPAPCLKPNSSPYEDLVAHLSRHHFFAEAQEVERSSITPDFFLTQYLESARLGKCSLYHQTFNFLDANRELIMEHVVPGQSLPESVPLDVTAWVDNFQRPPTHLLAVHSDTEAATLYAVHGPVLALQCVSVPFLPASKETLENGRTIKSMATLALRVPSLQHFNTVLRWLYSQSTTSLLQELLPLKHILTFLAKRSLSSRSSSRTPAESSSSSSSSPDTSPKPKTESIDMSKLSANNLIEAMSTLSTKAFLDRLQTIQAVWKNGVGLGIVSWNFWTVLDNAWNLTINAMLVSKRRSHHYKVAMAAANEITAQLKSTRIEE